MNVIIDRFEGEYAICEKQNREMISVLKKHLPESAKEGDVLQVEGDLVKIDSIMTEKRKREIAELTKDFWVDP